MDSAIKNKFWYSAMDFGSAIGCHQIPERSLFFKDYQFPVCARCTGIFIGQLLSIILLVLGVKINAFISIISVLTMIIDGGLQYFRYLKSTNLRRVVSGILGGFGYLNLMVIVFRHFIKFLALN